MKFATLVLTGALLVTVPALAHDAKGHHGGRVVDAGSYHVEMVTNGDEIEIFLIDHNNKQMTIAGYKGVAILSVDGKSQRITLEAGDGRLTGKAAAALPAQPKGVVQITPPGGRTVSAKF